MKRIFIILASFVITGCFSPRLPIKSKTQSQLTGNDFYKSVIGDSREEREEAVLNQILSGNMPAFLKKFKVVKYDTTLNGISYRMKIFVSGDYLSIGPSSDFARIPLTPMTAQQIADSFHCFLPTSKIVDLIYRNASVKLEPVPMYAYRDSSVTMYQHNLIIEGQRKLRKGLIAGIKKDVIITQQLKNKPNKVAIYGWHKLNGQPIQPVFTGHVDWYVDYSHGIRLIYDIIIVNGKKYHYTELLKDEIKRKLISDEKVLDFFKYPLPNHSL